MENHRPDRSSPRGRIVRFAGPYSFLSNMQLCSIFWEGVTYRSVEHAYQATKTLNVAERLRIATVQDPLKAKEEGRLLAVRPDWEEIKRGVMRELVRLKFKDPSLRNQLLATGDAEIIEGNDWGDRIWGQCPLGQGKNWLGEILMEERSRIRALLERHAQ